MLTDPEDVLADGVLLSELHAASIATADAAHNPSATDEYTRKDFTVVTLQLRRDRADSCPRVPFEKRSDLDPAPVPQDRAALSQLCGDIASVGRYVHVSADDILTLHQWAINLVPLTVTLNWPYFS